MSEQVSPNQQNSEPPEVVNPSVNFEKYDHEKADYILSRIAISNQSSSDITATTTSNPLIEYIVQYGISNFSRAELTYKKKATAAAGYHLAFYDDFEPLFQSISLSLGSGEPIININNVAEYNKIIQPINKTYQQMLNEDQSGSLKPYVDSPYREDNIKAYSSTILDGNAYGLPQGTYYGSFSNKEPRHLIIGGYGQDLEVFVRRRLNELSDTFFECDTDFLPPGNLTLSLTLNKSDRLGVRISADGTVSSLNQDVNIYDMYLWVPIQKNVIIQNSIAAMFRSSQLLYSFPVVRSYATTTTSATVQNVQYDFNQAYGRRLLKLIVVPFKASATPPAGEQFNNNNYNANLIKSYRTFLNGEPLQKDEVYCFQPDSSNIGDYRGHQLLDYDIMKDLFRDTCVLNRAQYQANWCHIDNFGPENHLLQKCGLVKKENIKAGIDLDKLSHGNIKYQWTATLANPESLRVFIFAVFGRSIRVLPNGFSWVE